MLKIFACDSNTTDMSFAIQRRSEQEIEQAPREMRRQYTQVNTLIDLLDAIARKKHTTRDQKIPLSREEFIQISNAVVGLPTQGTAPGGSSANTLSTLSRLIGKDRLHVDFLTSIGADMHGNMIRGGLEDAHINIVPKNFPSGVVPESAFSFVFNNADGTCTKCQYPGNIGQILIPEIVPQNLLNDSNIVFVQGALWEKMGRGTPDHLLDGPKKANQEIWLTLPTQSKFSELMTQTEYRKLIPYADVILTNQEELKGVMETKDLDMAIQELQRQMRVRQWRRDTKKSEPIAFITQAEEGATVVTPTEVTKIHAKLLAKETPNYFTGAGDTAFAGFLAGRIAKFSAVDCGKLAMELAAAKSKIISSRLPDPVGALQSGSEESRELLRRLNAGLEARTQELGCAISH